MGNDTTSSSVDGNGETMVEDLSFGGKKYSILTEDPYSIDAAGDLID